MRLKSEGIDLVRWGSMVFLVGCCGGSRCGFIEGLLGIEFWILSCGDVFFLGGCDV